MYNPDFWSKFEPYLDPDTWQDENGNIVDWKNRSLVKDAPQTAIDAFNEYKELEKESERKGIIL